MGIDISAYSKVTPLSDDSDAYDITLMDNTDFPGRIAPFKTGKYDCVDNIDVFSMSYGSYNRWRNWLAKLAGYPAVHTRTTIEPMHSAGACLQTHGPFWELISFSDCEGTIGTVACKKLLKDFEDYDASAKLASESWFYDKYVDVHEGLKLAAQGGCLNFS